VQGDIDCDGDVDEDDVFALLAGIATGEPGGPCEAAAGAGASGTDGRDVNCDSEVTGVDALHILLFVAGLPELDKPGDCAAVGSLI
jgi:hypothetical protein